MMSCDNPKCEKTSETDQIDHQEISFRGGGLCYAMPEIDLCGLCAGALSSKIIGLVNRMRGEETPDGEELDEQRS